MTANPNPDASPSAATDLPVVDLSAAFGLQPEYGAMAAQIAPALQISGFFYLANHGIDATRIDVLLTQMHQFFEADVQVREAIRIDGNNRGWLAPGQAQMKGARHHDLKEVFFFGRELDPDDPDLRAGVPLCAMNRWPADRPAFRAATLAWLDGIQQAGSALLACLAVHLGKQPDFFIPFYERPMARGQLIHYPAVRSDTSADQFGVAEHSDFGCITLLHQETAGLEVLTRQGQWLPVPPRAGHLVVNIGDLLERWTNGALPSTRHRVRNLTGASRYSVAIFFDPSPTAIIDPADLGAGNGGQKTETFAPIGAADYIMSQNQAVFGHYKP